MRQGRFGMVGKFLIGVIMACGLVVLTGGSSVIHAQGTRKVTPEGFEFSADTPVLKYHFPRGKHKATVYKGTWIAENAEEIKPNYEIDSAEAKPGAQPMVFFNLSKPKGDWPRGLYRLEIQADGVLVHTVKFIIQ